ncbi:hypothetical protein [Parapedobacter soli]|uniref:hypothetical protein n=1 Tax=Parapedobacter soli TaxID=416955 RepID=UPI0021C5FE58|nr:hypothetical protein [Parapedobacter soli]
MSAQPEPIRNIPGPMPCQNQSEETAAGSSSTPTETGRMQEETGAVYTETGRV